MCCFFGLEIEKFSLHFDFLDLITCRFSENDVDICILNILTWIMYGYELHVVDVVTHDAWYEA